MLLENGADPNLVDNFGLNMLQSVASTEIWSLLFSYGAEFKMDEAFKPEFIARVDETIYENKSIIDNDFHYNFNE